MDEVLQRRERSEAIPGAAVCGLAVLLFFLFFLVVIGAILRREPVYQRLGVRAHLLASVVLGSLRMPLNDSLHETSEYPARNTPRIRTGGGVNTSSESSSRS